MNDIIGPLFNKVDALGSSAIQSIYNQVATSLQPVFLLGMTIYVAFWGYEMLIGRVSVSPAVILWRLARMMLIYTLAFTWGDFQVLVVNVLTKTPDSVGAIVCQAVGGGSNCGSGGSGSSAVSSGLSEIWTAANEAASKISAAGGTWGIAMAVLSYIVIIVAGFFVAIAVFLVMFGKIALFVLLSLAPIFIAMMLFGITQPLFEGWVRSCAQYSLLPVIVYGILGFYIVLLKTSVDDLKSSTTDLSTALTTVGPFLLMCIVGYYLLYQCLSIAQGIAGGPRMTAGGADYHAQRLAGAGGRGLMGAARYIRQQGRDFLTSRMGASNQIAPDRHSQQQAQITSALDRTRS